MISRVTKISTRLIAATGAICLFSGSLTGPSFAQSACQAALKQEANDETALIHDCYENQGLDLSKCVSDKVDVCNYLREVKKNCPGPSTYQGGFKGQFKQHYCAARCDASNATKDVNTAC